MTLEQIRTLIQDDIRATDQLIIERTRSDVVLINQIGHYIIQSGGKRLRPLIVLLSARACGYEGTHHHTMAAVIEYIHTSTLLHDDVVDESDTRRGKDTANAVWGNAASVLVGDFLYSRAFEMMVAPHLMRIMEVMSEATNVIAAGEVMQLMNIGNTNLNEADYLEVIYRKTAKLFEAAAQMGPILTNQPELEPSLAAYGRHLGAAFQMVDDALDYAGDPEKLGKNIGDDLAEGKPTLPLIYLLEHGTPSEQVFVRQAIEQADIQQLPEILQLIKTKGGLEYTLKAAEKEQQKAIEALAPLPDSPYKDALIATARLAVHREA